MVQPPEGAKQLYKCESCDRVIGGLDANGGGGWSLSWERCKHYTLRSALLDRKETPLALSWAKAAAHSWSDSTSIYFAIKVS